VDPAPGRPGSPDGSAAAGAQIDTFFDAYRPMVLHYAGLSEEAGGVDAFVIGSELRGLTTVGSGPGAYPAVARLKALAADVRAVAEFWADPANNPVSPVYGGPMVDPANLHVWCWDARPYPDFPARREVWGDAENWALGHWISGRMGMIELPALVAEICRAVGFEDFDVSLLESVVAGYVLDRPMSPREALDSLMLAYRFDAVESGGLIRFVPRGGVAAAMTLGADDLVAPAQGDGEPYALARGQETDLPKVASLTYADMFGDYGPGSVSARRTAVSSDRMAEAELPILLDEGEARDIAERWLVDAWAERERADFVLPPSALALDPGDVTALEAGGRTLLVRLTEIAEAGERRASAVAVAPEGPPGSAAPLRLRAPRPAVAYGQPSVTVLDLPLLREGDLPQAPYVAAFARPWPGGVALYHSADGSASGAAGNVAVVCADNADGEVQILRIDFGCRSRAKSSAECGRPARLQAA
jgi:hypothetical protein